MNIVAKQKSNEQFALINSDVNTIDYYNHNVESFIEDTKNVDMHLAQDKFLHLLEDFASILDFGCHWCQTSWIDNIFLVYAEYRRWYEENGCYEENVR